MDLRFGLKILALAAMLPLAACGFRPLYGQGSNPRAISHFASIEVAPIPETVGYDLRNDLLDLFDSQRAPEGPRYRLRITLAEELRPIGLKNDATITRYDFYLNAHYELVLMTDNSIVTRGDLKTLTAYNVTASPYATVSAERDARRRAASDLAERIRTELAVFFYNMENPSVAAADAANRTQ